MVVVDPACSRTDSCEQWFQPVRKTAAAGAARWITVVALLSTVAVSSRAQADLTPPGQPRTPRWVGHFTVFAANGLVGGLTAGIVQELRGGSFQDGFSRGFLGGALIYLGKRVTVGKWAGAGFAGREVAAIGTSVVRNASAAEPSLARIDLPLGPLPARLGITVDDSRDLRLRLDIVSAAWLLYGLLEPRFELDVGEALSSGVPVFRAVGGSVLERGQPALGVAVARNIFLSDPTASGGPVGTTPDPALRQTLHHERVHVLQQDFFLAAWSEPLTNAVFQRVAPGRWVPAHLAVDGLWWVMPSLRRWIYSPQDAYRFPTELEADFLAR